MNIEQSQLARVYIHIPFCLSKCPYCFWTISYKSLGQTGLIASYLEALQKQIEFFSEQFNGKSIGVDSLYFGGGTPSLLEGEEIQRVIGWIEENFKLEHLMDDLSLEVNPGTVNLEKLKGYKKAGINRISIGAQSLTDSTLSTLGRDYDFKTVVETFNLAKEIGFETINIDLLFGVPSQSIKDWEETLNRVTDLNPDQVTTYLLFVHEGSAYASMQKKGTITLPPADEVNKMAQMAYDGLNREGYENFMHFYFCKPGKVFHSEYGTFYGSKSHIGFGAGAHSWYMNCLFGRNHDIQEYILNPTEFDFILDSRENRDPNYVYDKVIKHLCMPYGININFFNQLYGINLNEQIDMFPRVKQLINFLIEKKLIIRDAEKIQLIPKSDLKTIVQFFMKINENGKLKKSSDSLNASSIKMFDKSV